MNIGFTSYINAYPFHMAFQKGIIDPQAHLHFATPAQLNMLLRDQELDCALISSFEYLKGDYDFIYPFGIGAKGPIYSVNLYTKRWPASCLTCHVTEESATSVNLLKVLGFHFWKMQLILKPLDHSPLSTHESFLLIGNKALELQTMPQYHKIDLAEEWCKYTNMGFIFALFATHKMNKNTGILAQKFPLALHLALDWAENNFTVILERAGKDSLHSKAFLQTYYEAHSYRLTDYELQGLNLFAKLLSYV